MDNLCTAGGSGVAGELDDLLEDFTGYLRRERSLASTTVVNYLNQVRPFATWVLPTSSALTGGVDGSRCERVLGVAFG